ncbi:MAG TPA: transcriptional regulator, partial [Rugosimonospora sp.]|nr:transcriptional regulator [Rugosimonospora sp.]
MVDGVALTPAQRRIAQCLLEHAGSAAYLSSSEVAELAQVSQPSVTRFAMALGYDGYPALRRALRDSPGGTAGGDPPNEVQRAVRAEAESLGRLADRLGDGTPERAAAVEAGKLLAS